MTAAERESALKNGTVCLYQQGKKWADVIVEAIGPLYTHLEYLDKDGKPTGKTFVITGNEALGPNLKLK